MKKFLILLIFNFSFLISFGNFLEDAENIFTENYEINKMAELPVKAVIVQRMKVSNIDPALMRDEYSKKIIPLVYETLFRINSEGEIENSLVEKYSWLSERELYLKLKSKVLFHDNSEMTAKDVKKSLDYLREYGVLKNIYSEIRDIKVLSKNELTIKIAEEDNTFLNTLTYRISSIAKREKNKVFGTGKYKIIEMTGKEVKLETFLNYYGEVSPLKEIIYTWEIDEKQRLIRLFNDSADIALDVEERMFSQGKNIGILSEENLILPSKEVSTTVILFGNQNDYSVEMRRNLEKILPKKADTFFPEDILKAQLSKIDASYNKKEIENSVEKLKNKELKLMILNTENNMRYAQEIKEYLKKAGVELRIFPHQIESYNNKIVAKDFDIALFDIATSNNDLVFLMSKILLNDIKNIELYNALQPFFKLVKDESDREKREVIIDKMAGLIHKNVPYIIVEHHKYFTIVSPEFIEFFKKHKESLE